MGQYIDSAVNCSGLCYVCLSSYSLPLHSLAPIHIRVPPIYTHTHTQQSSCNYNRNTRGTSMSGSVAIKSESEEDLQTAVANVGPVSVAIDGANNAFRVGI